ncbi:hypothetical protein DPMN_024016 [Dreissena polymorpha]|uniref:Uncharacterized protein n=1 Tax=Dreissena polymorpha TaxID=45954 RepID=A0A9D4RB81_DREPO|nr:hypothetical protein DPMN_024016 [Dreissena polymorpha]
MSTTDDVQAGSDSDFHNRSCSRWLLQGCGQQMTCKLALRQISTTKIVIAGSDSNVHKK